MKPCADRESLLQAMLDGELDAAHAIEAEKHVRTCAGCAEYLNTMQQLRTRLEEADLNTPAPPRVRAKVEAMLEREQRAARPKWWSRLSLGLPAVSALAAAAAAFAVMTIVPAQTADLENQLVSSHVRSLQADHLIDVATSDRHVVKPWFNGKIDFAPPVPDLAGEGFPLQGGRLDYAGRKTIAAVVYKRRAHVINLFVLPHEDAGRIDAHRDSYSIVQWRQGDLDFWAVSDVERGDLVMFRDAFQAATR